MHLQILFNITTAVVDIWSERTDYGFLVSTKNPLQVWNEQETRRIKHGYRPACTERWEYTDSFSSGRALHNLISSYRGNDRLGSQFPHSFSETSSTQSGVYHIDVLGSIIDNSIHKKAQSHPQQSPSTSSGNHTGWSHLQLHTRSPMVASNKVLCG